MSSAAPMWVRVGGGMESRPEHQRHGPADVEFPPPDGPWEALVLNGRLVGWGDHAGLSVARRCFEVSQQMVAEHRDHLLGRLGHKLRSSVLALQESARQAAFGRQEMLEALYEQAQEVGRRAAALEAVAIAPKDGARGVVLGAVMNLAVPAVSREIPSDAAVLGSEPILVDAFSRLREWLGESISITAQKVGAWWKVQVRTPNERRAPAVPELGEPLLRFIVDVHLQGWFDASSPDHIDVYLPAHRPR